jgi:hypothetical protein
LTVEHLAVLGIVIFGFMAVMNLFTAVRSFKRFRRVRGAAIRVRRLIGGPDAAMAVARSVVKGISEKLPGDVANCRETGTFSNELEKSLDVGRRYYLSRVEPIHRELFTKAVDEIIRCQSGDTPAK